jgi:hypothetical protein
MLAAQKLSSNATFAELAVEGGSFVTALSFF